MLTEVSPTLSICQNPYASTAMAVHSGSVSASEKRVRFKSCNCVFFPILQLEIDNYWQTATVIPWCAQSWSTLSGSRWAEVSVILLNTFCTAGMLIRNTGRTVVAKETSRWHADSSNFSCTWNRGGTRSGCPGPQGVTLSDRQHSKLPLPRFCMQNSARVFITRVLTHWNRLCRGGWCPILSLVKRHLDDVLNVSFNFWLILKRSGSWPWYLCRPLLTRIIIILWKRDCPVFKPWYACKFLTVTILAGMELIAFTQGCVLDSWWKHTGVITCCRALLAEPRTAVLLTLLCQWGA